jgi:hypothetical protein
MHRRAERTQDSSMINVKNVVAAGLLSAAVAVGMIATASTAAADAWPGCPEDHPSGPCHWCPGNPPVQTGNHVTNPVRWDESVCHTYWYVYFGQGNVAQNIFEGDAPPPPPPPADPGPFVIDRSNCQQILGMFCPKA